MITMKDLANKTTNTKTRETKLSKHSSSIMATRKPATLTRSAGSLDIARSARNLVTTSETKMVTPFQTAVVSETIVEVCGVEHKIGRLGYVYYRNSEGDWTRSTKEPNEINEMIESLQLRARFQN